MNFREALLKNRSPVGNRKMHFVERTSRDVLEQADALPFWSQDYTQLDRGSFTYVIGIPTIIEGEASWGGAQVKSDSLITLDKNGELLFKTSHFSEITAAVISADHLEEYAGQVEDIDLRKLMNNVNPVEIIPTDVAQRLLSALNSSTNYISKSSGNPNIQHILRHFEDNLLDTCLQALLNAGDCRERH